MTPLPTSVIPGIAGLLTRSDGLLRCRPLGGARWSAGLAAAAFLLVTASAGAHTAGGLCAAAVEHCERSTVRDLVSGSGIEFEERGERELKGVPGAWKAFAAS